MGIESDAIAVIKEISAELDKKAPKAARDIFATIELYNNTFYAVLDGSTERTPITSGVTVHHGDRVIVHIVDHKCIVTQNITVPSVNDEEYTYVKGIAEEANELLDGVAEAAQQADKTVAEILTASDTANGLVEGMQSAATTAGTTLAQIVSDADSAATTLAGMQQAATAASTTLNGIYADAEAAKNGLVSVVQGATTVEKAVSVMQTALEAVVDYDPQNDTVQEYFWHDDHGAHVLGDVSGYRNDIDSTGMDIVETSTEDSVAKFEASGARIGKPSELATSIKKNGFSIYSDVANGGDPFFSVTMPSNVGTEQLAFYEIVTSSSTFPIEIDLEYSDGVDDHPISSVYELYKISVQGFDSLPMVAQDAILVYSRGDLVGNNGMLPDYITEYDEGAHKLKVDDIGLLADVLDAHPYALIKGILADDITYEQPQMLFDVDGGGSMHADYHSLKLIDLDNAEYFHVSDLRGHDGFAYYTDTFTGDGTTQRFIISVRAAYNDVPEPTVYIDGTQIYWIDDPNVGAISYDLDAVSQALTFWNVSGGSLGTQYTPANGAHISITYAVDGDIAKSFTFGSRNTAHVGPMSSAFGYNVLSSGEISFAEGDETAARGHASHAQNMGTVAASDYQTALGKYNTSDDNGDYAVIVGNGTADNARSNAAALQWDGTLELAKPLPVAGGGTGTTAFGTHYAPTMGASKSVNNSAWTQLHSFKLAAGKWLILAYLYAAAHTTGYRAWTLTTSSTAPSAVSLYGNSLTIPGGNTAIYAAFPMFVEPAAETTYYAWGYQNSGGALNMRANLTAIRLG